MHKRWWEKKNQDGKVYLAIAIILSTLMIIGGTSWIAWAAVQYGVGNHVWDNSLGRWVKQTSSTVIGVTSVDGTLTPGEGMANPTTAVRSGSYNLGWNGSTWDRLKTTTAGDGLTTGLLGTGLYGYGSATWNRLATSYAYNASLDDNVLATGVYGGDFIGGGTTMMRVSALNLNTSNSIGAGTGGNAALFTASVPFLSGNFSAQYYYEQMRGVSWGDNLTTGLPATGLYGYDGTNWDRAKIDTNGSLYVNPGALADTTDAVIANTTSNATSAITTNATTAVKATGGKMMKVITRSDNPGATSTIRFYDIASGGCTGTPASGDTVILLDTTTDNTIYDLNHQFTNGICAVTAGGTAAYVTVTYR